MGITDNFWIFDSHSISCSLFNDISAVRNYRFIEIGNSSGNQITAYGYKGGITNETGLMYIRPKSLNTGTTPTNGIMTQNGATFDYQTNTLVTCGGYQVSFFELLSAKYLNMVNLMWIVKYYLFIYIQYLKKFNLVQERYFTVVKQWFFLWNLKLRLNYER